MKDIFIGIMIPFLGTSLGAACVFFMRGGLDIRVQRPLLGFAAGVMVAASIWSLILPAAARCEYMGRLAFLPAAAGFWAGILFLLVLDMTAPQFNMDSAPEGKSKTNMLVFAVTLHNIPEGMAVGVIYAALAAGTEGISAAAALALAIGIAIQNFPEGAIISLPLRANGADRKKAFLCGVASGVVEPLGAALTVACAKFIAPAMPYLLSFAAGAMLYVVVEELVPEMSAGEHSTSGALFFAIGFSLMMSLDMALG